MELRGVREYGCKTQELCPKCGRMYCEGFWGEGVCTKDMHFCGEPTADFDAMGSYLRDWYEKNRESWWERRSERWPPRLGTADGFILGLIQEVERIKAERDRQTAK